MKYLKTYESIKNEGPQIGDYVIVKLKGAYSFPNDDYRQALENNVLIITNIGEDGYTRPAERAFRVKIYRDWRDEVGWGWWVSEEEIIQFSKNKEYLMNVKKYNL